MIVLKVQKIVDGTWETVEIVNITDYDTNTIASQLKSLLPSYKALGQKVSLVLKKGYDVPKGLFVNPKVNLPSGDSVIWFDNAISINDLLRSKLVQNWTLLFINAI